MMTRFSQVLELIERREYHAAEGVLSGVADLEKSPEGMFYLGVCRMRLGQPGAALLCFDTALSVAPWSVEASNSRGICRLELGDVSNAVRDFRAAIKRDRRYIPALGNLVRCCLRTGRSGFAVRVAGYMCRIDSNSHRALLLLADAHFASGSVGVAYDLYQRVLELDPKCPAARSRLAERCIEHKDLRGAAMHLSIGLRVSPTSPSLLRVVDLLAAAGGSLPVE